MDDKSNFQGRSEPVWRAKTWRTPRVIVAEIEEETEHEDELGLGFHFFGLS